MRNVVGLLLCAVVGTHCSAPTEPAEIGEPELVAPATDTSEPQRGAPVVVPDDPREEDEPAASVMDLSALVQAGRPPHVTSAVKDEHGATYAVGTFTGGLTIGHTFFRSRGDKDILVMKLAPDGSVAWARAVGSVATEDSARAVIDSAHGLTVLGLTAGAMDCGFGPLGPTWSSGTFFVCTFGGEDGSSIAGGVFPTGNL
jgi:hypothetical protein